MSAALDRYERYLIEEKGNLRSTVETTMHRLRKFFDGDEPIRRITSTRAKALYTKYRTTKTRTGKPPTPDTHRNTLGQARTFAKWCVEQRYLTRNPLAEVKGVGRKNRRKGQLRKSEAERFVETALGRAGDDRAAAALVALLMGLRSSEVAGLEARDLDEGGRLLWIDRAKTAAGERKLRVPDVLRPLLTERAMRRGRLFPGLNRDKLLRATKALCKAAGVTAVTTHGLRGTHATLATEAGLSADFVAKALGHASTTVTESHYVTEEAAAAARQERAFGVIAGGKR